MAKKPLVDPFVLVLADESPPVWNQVQQRWRGNQGIVASGKMGRGARPGQFLRAGAKTCAHWIAFDGPRNRKHVSLVHHEGRGALLPQIPLPTLAEVDHASVPAMGFAERVPSAEFVCGNQDEVNMLGHQAIGQHLRSATAAGFSE